MRSATSPRTVRKMTGDETPALRTCGEQFQPVAARQHAIEDHQVVDPRGGLVQTGPGMFHPIHRKALLAEPLLQLAAELGIVLHHQYPHRRASPPVPAEKRKETADDAAERGYDISSVSPHIRVIRGSLLLVELLTTVNFTRSGIAYQALT